MAIGNVSLRFFVLGLLKQRAMSGYDIRRVTKNVSWLIGSPSCGGLYPALRSLVQDGMATVEVLPSIGRPARKLYSITGVGNQALTEWSRKPSATGSLKAFIMRLMVAGKLSSSELTGHLEQRRADVARYQDALEQASIESAQDGGSAQRLALEYGLAVGRAELAWLDATLRGLSQATTSPEGVQGALAQGST